ncbi:MAG: preprotein translocase subunit SecE [Patescibacteria group bacterium]|jgi:preprotein translocase subunit SecE
MLSITNNRVVRYFLETRDELKKVAWPTQKEAITYSAFVIGICLVLAAYFGVIDELLTLGLKALVQMTSGK